MNFATHQLTCVQNAGKPRCNSLLSSKNTKFYLFYFNFFATPQIKMKTIQEKMERMDLTMARRPKGNYEAYIN